MAREFNSLHIKISGGPSPNPYRWEICRGADPAFVERGMHGYLTENEALQDAQAALERLINREAQNRGG